MCVAIDYGMVMSVDEQSLLKHILWKSHVCHFWHQMSVHGNQLCGVFPIRLFLDNDLLLEDIITHY